MRKVFILAAGIGALIFVIGSLFILNIRYYPHKINELWHMEIDHNNLEGKTVVVKGDTVFDPLSEFRFNALYLMDSETPEEYRQPDYAFWFGIRIDDLACSIAESTWICEPFDPSQASAFEFKGASRYP